MKCNFHEINAYAPRRRNLLIIWLLISLLLVCVLQAGAAVNSQSVTLLVTGMPLEKVCKEVEKQTGYYFVYAKDMDRAGYRLTLDLRNVRVEEALRRIFEGLPFTYQVIDKVVVVNTLKKQVVKVTMGERLIKVNGVVMSDQGQPLQGASVATKANGRVTLTNIRGEFSFSNIPEGSILVVSYIGYSTQQVRAQEQDRMLIKLTIATDVLDGMVIKGYYNTTNRLNTGSISIIKGEDIAKQPVTDPLLAMQGRVPGLYIQQTSGVPGAYSTIHLRGVNSIPSIGKLSTLNDPLFIVDGVPFNTQSLTNTFIGGGVVGVPSVSSITGFVDANAGQGLSPFNNLNPADIESIEVLKDADATAIYGSRGGNGVIVITTKKGKAGPTKVDINLFSGVGKITRTLDLMNTEQYLQMRREAFRNDGISPGTIDFDVNGFWDTTRYTNWQKVLINHPSSFNSAQINISGGNANTQFSIGGGYTKQGTSFPGNYSDQKASVHISLSNVSTDQRFRTQFSAGYTNDNSNLPRVNLTQYITLAPNAPALYDANGALNWQVYNGRSSWANPLAYTNAKAKAMTDLLNANLVLGYQPFSGLTIKSSFGYNRSQLNQTNLTPLTYYGPPQNTRLTARNNAFGTTDSKIWIIEPQVSYDHSVGKGKLDLLVGATFQRNYLRSQGTSTNGYASDALLENPMLASSIILLGYTSSANYYSAVFGRIGYNWKDKYLLNITARRDGSSRFGPGKQFGNFGAIGAAWIFSREMFLADKLSFLSFGKLRMSYGSSGNNNIEDYQFMSTYSINSSLQYQGNPILSPARMPNPYYSWERVKKLEAALELGVLKDRIFFSVSYYRNRSDNQLIGYKLPFLTGFGSVQANLPALVQNTGWELTLNTINLRKNDWSWNSTFNLSIPRNKLVAYPDFNNSPYIYSFSIGQPLFIRYFYHYAGVDPQTGTYVFSAKNASGSPSFPTPNDQTFSKAITQSFFGGMQNSFRFKGFQLDVFFQFVKQLSPNYLVNFNIMPGSKNLNMPVFLLNNHWQHTGDHAATQKFSTQQSEASTAYSNYLSSDGNLFDGSFIRLKNLALSYELPTTWRKAAHLQSARIYLQCQNLVTFTHYMGLDPETGGLLPPIRMITGGCQIGF